MTGRWTPRVWGGVQVSEVFRQGPGADRFTGEGEMQSPSFCLPGRPDRWTCCSENFPEMMVMGPGRVERWPIVLLDGSGGGD
jgi:hypothetical protein